VKRAGIALSLTLLVGVAVPQARAADYWAYTYRDLDVMAEGTQTDALSVGRRLGAIDETLRKLLHLPAGAYEPPTRVYALPQSELAGLDAVWSSQGGAFFRAGPFDDFVVLHNDTPGGDQEVNAERVRALLASWGLARLPDWYRHGIALLMSAASFDQDHMTVGQDVAERSARLAHGWIPMSQFLQLPASDPILHRSPETEATYEAQCWWLVHLSLLDGVLDKVMPLYLQRLLMGESQESAYAATFGRPYEQLDEYFKKLRRNLKLRPYTSALPDPAALGSPHPLSEAEVKARVAELLLVHEPKSEAGAQMASDALSAEPKNERAVLAVARHELGARHYVQVQESVQQLGVLEDLSAASHRDLGTLLSTLLRHRDEGMPGSNGVDTKTTRTAARTHYQRAIALAPDDPRAPYQLGWLLCGQGDVTGIRELLPTVEAAFYRRPESAEFAELLVRMHTIAGNTADVFKYSVAEQRLAATEAERARASARVERLRAQLKTPQ
jgi:tetratricopeptide (TPR) repeat protein